MQYPKPFVDNVHLFFKEEGKAWLDRLPELIRYCEDKWTLHVQEPYSLSINFVAPAVTNEGKEVVVKMCIPGEGFWDELEALRLFKDQGIASLIDYDQENGILILEKITPGHTLAELTDHEAACREAADVVRRLLVPAPQQTRLPTTKAREDSLRKTVETSTGGYGPFSEQTLHKALAVFTYLNKTIEKYWLLHGDFHHYNVLATGEDSWIAIDPKGLVGEIEYDFIQYMLNCLPEQGATDVIKTRVDVCTEELALNKERLLLYGFCHAVLSTCWMVDDEDGSYDGDSHRVVTIFEALYEHEMGKSISEKLMEEEF